MSKKNLHKYQIAYLIIVGTILRLVIFWVNPVNNSYDDHLEVIKLYSDGLTRPEPFQCWECYQPPLYYYVSAMVFNFFKFLEYDKFICWKSVQFINTFLSILLLFITFKLFQLFQVPRRSVFIIMSFIVILPIDIFTSAMIGNDYMLVFFSILSFYFYVKALLQINSQSRSLIWFLVLLFTSAFAGLTKQHGLLIFIFPFAILFRYLTIMPLNKIFWALGLFLVAVSISLTDEIRKFVKTGEILVSNQHYFNYAKSQFPGSLNKVEFFTFRIFELFKEPFISENTAASFFTEIFAKSFYDYEWRFISPKIPWATSIAIVGYSIGLLWLLYLGTIFLINAVRFNLSQENILFKLVPICLALLFMIVPVLQTMRYPYFSSMKSMYMLSGIILLLIILGSKIKQGSFLQKIALFIIPINILYGVILVASISIYLTISLNHLHGPLWRIP
jgi:hypothetical protein